MIKVKEKSLSVLIHELDDIFSEWVRRNEADESGYIKCFVTGERIYWKDADAAHFIGRSKMATRYHELNVHACSRDSNRCDPDHNLKYYLAMENKYGWLIRQGLEQASKSLMKYTRSDILEMIENYKLKIKELKK